MPNDTKPDHHGDSPHHQINFEIQKIFNIKQNSFEIIEFDHNKLSMYRNDELRDLMKEKLIM